ncbi:MAG TPA: pentapeptide repeat-containing protein, partial [Phenylobacterium sp.]|nr:pentapeptide repeat-containing protein [Phenylobacterium sp.]
MTAFTQAQLDEALNAHERFVNRAGGGMRLILRYTVLDGLDLAGRDLREVDLSACSLVGCDLRVARLDQAVLFGCDLSQADLTGATLVRADLRGTVLCGANLTGVDMTDADCRPGKVVQNSGDNTLNSGEGRATDATGAVLQRASLDRSTADNADFSDCALVDA